SCRLAVSSCADELNISSGSAGRNPGEGRRGPLNSLGSTNRTPSPHAGPGEYRSWGFVEFCRLEARGPAGPPSISSRSDPDRNDMRIGINLYALTLHGGGMREYVVQLLPWLVRRSSHSFLLFYASQGQPSLALILRQLSRAERSRVETVEIVHQD